MRLGKRGVLASGVAGLVIAATAASASAATFPVPCGDVNALRTAITTANNTAGDDTIDVTGAPCVFNVANAAVVQAGGNTGLPIVTSNLTIEGHGATIRRTGADNYRLLFAASPNFSTIPRVVLRDLVIRDGRLTGASQNGAGVAGFLADVVLERVTLLQNQTAGRGGGAAVVGGSLDATRTNFAGNVAAFGAGFSTTTTASQNDITRSSIYFNVATNNSGAALIENGTALIENTTVAANSAANGSGGVTSFTSAAATPASVTVRSTTLGDNSAANQTAPGTSLWALSVAGGAATITATDTVVTDTDSQAAAVTAPCLEGAGGAINSAGGNVEWPTTSCDFEVEANPRVTYVFLGSELFARLLAGSAAIDAGGDDCPPVDQFGRSRPGGLACDSGSWETVPPDTTVNGPASPTSNPTVTFTSSQPNSTFECRIDGNDPWTACTSPFTPNLPDGEHTVEVRALNQLGETDPTPGSVTFIVDKTGPTVEIDPVASPTSDPTVEITFTGNDANGIAGFTCKVDDTDPVPCTSPFTTPALAEGSHTVTVEATDNAGNKGSDSVTFVVDLPPETVESYCRRDTLLLHAECKIPVQCPVGNSGCTLRARVDVRTSLTGIVHGDVFVGTPDNSATLERQASSQCGAPAQITSHCVTSTDEIVVDPGDTAFAHCSGDRRGASLAVVLLQMRCTAYLTKNVGSLE